VETYEAAQNLIIVGELNTFCMHSYLGWQPVMAGAVGSDKRGDKRGGYQVKAGFCREKVSYFFSPLSAGAAMMGRGFGQ
jgi:hypothetical protein